MTEISEYRAVFRGSLFTAQHVLIQLTWIAVANGIDSAVMEVCEPTRRGGWEVQIEGSAYLWQHLLW